MYIATERLFLNKDKTKIVPESEGHYVLCGPGSTLTDEEAAFYGLANPPEPVPELVAIVDPEPEAECVIESPPADPVPDPAPDILEPVIDDEPEVEEKAIEEPPENKAVRFPPEVKRDSKPKKVKGKGK